ncbi:MAG: biopolymer transporter ExbD [Hyphomonadaceae bacterium]|nr:biopolymer transporter ExbD [Hyphomonadaceae bacterium]
MATAVLRPTRRFRLEAEPNVIPFIDVMLVLLVIFMVTTPKPTTDLRVDLPGPGAAIAAALPPTIVRIVEENGAVAFYVGGEKTAPDMLGEQALTLMLSADASLDQASALGDGRVFVHAGLDVPYHHVVDAVDALQHVGFRKVTIAAQDADAPA